MLKLTLLKCWVSLYRTDACTREMQLIKSFDLEVTVSTKYYLQMFIIKRIHNTVNVHSHMLTL